MGGWADGRMSGWTGGRNGGMDGPTRTGVQADRWADGWAARPCFGAAFCRGRGRGTKSLSSSLLLVYMSSASMAVDGRVAANEEAVVKFVVVLARRTAAWTDNRNVRPRRQPLRERLRI